MSETKIKSIVIQFPGGKTMEMSLEDARELSRKLHDLFEPTGSPLPYYPIYVKDLRPNFPIWTDDHTTPLPEKMTVSCVKEST